MAKFERINIKTISFHEEEYIISKEIWKDIFTFTQV
jgi:hypothetical protein